MEEETGLWKNRSGKQKAKNRVVVWKVKEQVRETGIKRTDGGENWERSRASRSSVLLQAFYQTEGKRCRCSYFSTYMMMKLLVRVKCYNQAHCLWTTRLTSSQWLQLINKHKAGTEENKKYSSTSLVSWFMENLVVIFTTKSFKTNECVQNRIIFQCIFFVVTVLELQYELSCCCSLTRKTFYSIKSFTLVEKELLGNKLVGQTFLYNQLLLHTVTVNFSPFLCKFLLRGYGRLNESRWSNTTNELK